MRRALIVAAGLLISACNQQPANNSTGAASAITTAPLQCAKDTDCKGDRICESGKCVAPNSNTQAILQEPGVPTSAAAAPAAPPTGNPKFKDYPAPPLYSGPPAKLLLDSDFAKEYRSRLTEAMADTPTFAGEYVLTGWGCGSGGCYVESLVNKRTGKALETNFGAHSVWTDMENGVEERVGEWIVSKKIDSNLLVTQEVTEDDEGNPHEYFAKFYVADSGQLKLIKKVAIPKPAPGAN